MDDTLYDEIKPDQVWRRFRDQKEVRIADASDLHVMWVPVDELKSPAICSRDFFLRTYRLVRQALVS